MGFRAATAASIDTKIVALTFDDGPSTTWTDEILALMEKNAIKTTFFMVGQIFSATLR